jgi:hypothetical protein
MSMAFANTEKVEQTYLVEKSKERSKSLLLENVITALW